MVIGRSAVKRALTYVANVKAVRRRPGPKPDLLQLTRCFVPWWRSFNRQDTLDRDALPWLTFPAVEFLKHTIRPHWKIFEFGSGASTIFFARRCKEVYSVEHDNAWAERVKIALHSMGLSNFTVQHIPPVSRLPNHQSYRSQFPGYEGYDFQDYVRSIDQHADGSLDLVLVDGRCRDVSLKHAISKVRPGGVLILDNTERPRYEDAIKHVPKTWEHKVFPGPCAAAELFTETMIWIAPQFPNNGGTEILLGRRQA
jgi:predicted O-methyltransferase YrrM